MSPVAASLRTATADDAGLLAVLGAQVFLEAYAPKGITPKLAREVQTHFSQEVMGGLLADDGLAFRIAERDGHAVGFSQVARRSPCSVAAEGPAHVELQRLYVLKTARQQGVGKALLHDAQQQAAALGQHALWLSAWVGNTHALRFYAMQGYRDAGTLDYVFEDERFENRVLWKPLGDRTSAG